jgi:hypothetical protein
LILFDCFSMVSLDGQQKSIRTLPNKYIYHFEKKLSPTEYKSVLSTEFVLFLDNRKKISYFFFGRYEFENIANGEISNDKFRVQTTAIYTALVYNTNNDKVG